MNIITYTDKNLFVQDFEKLGDKAISKLNDLIYGKVVVFDKNTMVLRELVKDCKTFIVEASYETRRLPYITKFEKDVIFHSVDEMFKTLQFYDSKNIFLIVGKGNLSFVPFAEKVIIIKSIKNFGGDVKIQNFAEDLTWQQESYDGPFMDKDDIFGIVTYYNSNPKTYQPIEHELEL